MAWTIDFDAGALKSLGRLGRQEQLRIQRFLIERVALAKSPRELGKPLVGSKFGELWRYRVGDYRLICKIDDGILLVLVLESAIAIRSIAGHRLASAEKSVSASGPRNGAAHERSDPEQGHRRHLRLYQE